MWVKIDANMRYNHAVRWIWQQSDWPDFRYDKRILEDRDIAFRINSERLTGRFEALPMAYQKNATIDLMLSEAIKTSAIERMAVGSASLGGWFLVSAGEQRGTAT